MTKVCIKCGQEKSKFHRNKNRSDGFKNTCVDCVNEQKRKEYNTLTTEEKRRATLKKYHGISLEQYNDLVAAQDSKCLLCDVKSDALVIDHDHSCCDVVYKKCGKCIRGLLCSSCNAGLGIFKDSPVFLQRAIDYLNKGKAGYLE